MIERSSWCILSRRNPANQPSPQPILGGLFLEQSRCPPLEDAFGGCEEAAPVHSHCAANPPQSQSPPPTPALVAADLRLGSAVSNGFAVGRALLWTSTSVPVARPSVRRFPRFPDSASDDRIVAPGTGGYRGWRSPEAPLHERQAGDEVPGRAAGPTPIPRECSVAELRPSLPRQNAIGCHLNA
jgi:hypothetical protein